MRGRILIVDDDRAMGDMLADTLSRRGFATNIQVSGADAFSLLSGEDFDAVVTDLNMRGMSGLELCERVHANRPDVPVLVITAFGSLETAVKAIRAGAYDFITKPFEPEQLALALDRAVQLRNLREELKRLRAGTEPATRTPVIGESAPMQALRALVERVAQTDVSVMITGETGTGKELVARTLHARSARAAGPFVAINCAALPEQLLESELFGHVKGAFTDARSDRRGLFQQANEGTLFLDEIGEMPISLQPKLLRALQERRVRPVGAEQELPFDSRVIAASNRDLEAAVESGEFRQDLLYRLDVIRIELPPLRVRGGDVLVLAQRFIEECASRLAKGVRGMTSSAAQKLLAYSWPGNVRELQNCIERAVAVTDFENITVEDLPAKVRSYSADQMPSAVASDDLVPLHEIERRYIRRVLEACGGNKTAAAQILAIDRKTLLRKLGGTSGEAAPTS